MRLIRSAAVKKREDGKHMKKVLSLVLAIVMVALVGIVPGALADGKEEERYFFWSYGKTWFNDEEVTLPSDYTLDMDWGSFYSSSASGTAYIITNSPWKESNIKTSGDYTYYLLDNGTIALLAIDPNHPTSKVTLPEQIDGYTVSRIGLSTDAGCGIGTYDTEYKSFSSRELLQLFADNVTEVVLPDTVEVVGCNALEKSNGYCVDKLTAKGVKEIGFIGFVGYDLEEMKVPTTLTKIGDLAFYNSYFNYGRNKVTLTDDLVEIGAFAFANSYLKELTIPGSVQKIGMYACANMDNLRTAKLKKGLTTVGEGMFMLCPKLKEITIPETVTTIQAHAFEQCEKLGKVTIAKNSELTSIGEGAFRSCTTLKSIVLPEGVTTIEKDAFFDCSKLSTVTLPASLTAIGDYAFDGCSDTLKFIVVEGSYAQQWAESKGYQTKVTKAK